MAKQKLKFVCSTKIIQWALKKKKVVPYIIYTSWSGKKFRSFLSLRKILSKCLSETYPFCEYFKTFYIQSILLKPIFEIRSCVKLNFYVIFTLSIPPLEIFMLQ